MKYVRDGSQTLVETLIPKELERTFPAQFRAPVESFGLTGSRSSFLGPRVKFHSLCCGRTLTVERPPEYQLFLPILGLPWSLQSVWNRGAIF
jgi:hypothetical protein